jgi:tRNA (cmo5U34)-methyltransferase
MVRSEIPTYDRLQVALAEATSAVRASAVLDLGSGTGVTAEQVLRVQPGASLIGIDGSDQMLVHARRSVRGAEFLVGRLEDPLPPGPFDLVVSAFAIHHLNGATKADLFRRVASALVPRGRFVMLDVVISTGPVARPVPIEPGVDLPSSTEDLLRWLRDADLEPTVVYAEDDLALIAADRRG